MRVLGYRKVGGMTRHWQPNLEERKAMRVLRKAGLSYEAIAAVLRCYHDSDLATGEKIRWHFRNLDPSLRVSDEPTSNLSRTREAA